jgi:hypothetical protein
MWMPLDVVDIHGTAQHHEPVIASDLGPRMWMPPKVRITDAKPARLEERMQGAQDLEGNMLKNE